MLLAPFLSLFLALCPGDACASTPPSPAPGFAERTSEALPDNIALPAANWTLAKAVLPGFTIHHQVAEVRLQFSVSDDQGRPLTDLSLRDFQILDNQRAVTKVRDFSRSDDLPVQLGLLLDVSDSVQNSLLGQRQAVQCLITQLLRWQNDRAFLASFSKDAKLWQGYTSDPSALRQALSIVQQTGYVTYLYDTLYRICLQQFSPDQTGEISQRILVLISDGEDTGSIHSLEDAVAVAQRRGIEIFTMSLHPPRLTPPGDKILKRLADATGGAFFVVSSDKDFSSISMSMEQQMRTQFAVSFQPAEPTTGFHAVQIRPLGDSELRVHARQSYVLGTP